MTLGRPCDVDGNFLAAGESPPPREKLRDFDSFGTRTRFETAEVLYEESETGRAKVDRLLRIWAAENILNRSTGKPPFENYDDMVAAIDGLSVGSNEWYSFTLGYNGPIEENTPAWKRRGYTIYARNPLTTFENQLANPTLKNKFDRAPLREYTRDRKIRYANFNSGRWAWREAVRIHTFVTARSSLTQVLDKDLSRRGDTWVDACCSDTWRGQDYCLRRDW